MQTQAGMLRYLPFSAPTPSRRVVLAWRKSFTRRAAIDALAQAVRNCQLPGVSMLTEDTAIP
jgi:LysR family hydrogen peroxide-inducible transcriptional activator